MNNITFIPSNKDTELIVPIPQPAKKYIPDWYKSIPSIDNIDPEFDTDGSVKNRGLKACMPFLDAMTSGYIQESWCDIFIKYKNKELGYNYPISPKIMEHREKSNLSLEGFYPTEFSWAVNWIPKTPKGWSILITHPINQYHLPFLTLTGVIDSDVFNHTPAGNIPFYIKDNFTGVIPAGTPMFQMIPIKRENWKTVKEDLNEDNIKKKSLSVRKYFFNSYKNNFWIKKTYE